MMMAPKKHPDNATYSGRFATRLYELRQKAGLSAEQVAERLGMNVATVYYWESGKTSPKIDMIPDLSIIYGLENSRDIFPIK